MRIFSIFLLSMLACFGQQTSPVTFYSNPTDPNYGKFVAPPGSVAASANGFGGGGTGSLTLIATGAATGTATGTGTVTISLSLANSVVGLGNLTATGSPSTATFLRGDNSWATPPGSTYFADGASLLLTTGTFSINTANANTWTGTQTFGPTIINGPLSGLAFGSGVVAVLGNSPNAAGGVVTLDGGGNLDVTGGQLLVFGTVIADSAGNLYSSGVPSGQILLSGAAGAPITGLAVGSGLSVVSGTLTAPSGGVTSFNTRTGSITLTSSDVDAVGALSNNTSGTAANITGTITAAQVSGLGSIYQPLSSTLTTLAGSNPLTAGTNITFGGTWPNLTINAASSTQFISALGSNMTGFTVTTGTLNLSAPLGSAAFTASTAYAPSAGSSSIVTVGTLSAGSIPYSLVTGGPTALPPNGAAGGNLSGTYPNPSVIGGTGTFSGTFTGSGSGLTSLPTNTALYPTLNQNTTGNAATATSALTSGTSTFSTTSGTATFATTAGNGGVTSFNTRTGSITLTSADVNATGTLTNNTTGNALTASSSANLTGTITPAQVSGANSPGGFIAVDTGTRVPVGIPATATHAPTGSIVNCIGDSITAGFPVVLLSTSAPIGIQLSYTGPGFCYPQWLSLQPYFSGIPVYDWGVGGTRSSAGAAVLSTSSNNGTEYINGVAVTGYGAVTSSVSSLYSSTGINYYFNWYGANDQTGSVSSATFISNMNGLYATEHGYGSNVIVTAFTSTQSNATNVFQANTFQTTANIPTYNANLYQGYGTSWDRLADINNVFSQTADQTQALGYMNSDELHYLSYGYKTIADEAFRALSVSNQQVQARSIYYAQPKWLYDPSTGFPTEDTTTGDLYNGGAGGGHIIFNPVGYVINNSTGANVIAFNAYQLLDSSGSTAVNWNNRTLNIGGNTLGNWGTLANGFTFLGTTSANNATAGWNGEYTGTMVPSTGTVTLTTATTGTITSLTLTPGDWDVEGNINYTYTGATVTSGVASFSTTGTILTTGQQVYDGNQLTLGTTNDSLTLGRFRSNSTGTVTVYMLTNRTFSAGTVSAFGSMNARRVR